MKRFAGRAFCSLLFVLLCLTNVGVERARATTAGTVISDTVTMGYQDPSSNTYAAVSNTVTTTVANLPSLSITTPAGQNTTPSMITIDSFTLTNTGNAAGNFQLLNTPPFAGTATGTTSAGYTLNGATSGTCSTATLCSFTVLGTQLAALSATAIGGTISIGVAYQALGASTGQTVQTPFTANISYPVNGSVAAATGAATATSADTVVADARLDLQASAVSAANITWTFKGNNGGGYAAHDSAALPLVKFAPAGVAVITQVPAFGGVALVLQSTPTCTLSGAGSGAAATLYYSATASNPIGANWSTTYASTSAWVACLISGATGGNELPSAPGQSAGAGSVTTAQVTLTVVTAKPSGSGSDATGAVSAIANGYIDGGAWAAPTGSYGLLGAGIALGTADSSAVALNTSATEGNTTPSVLLVPPGGSSNIALSQASVAQPRLDIQTTVVQPSSAAPIAWTVKANNGGTGIAYGSNTCLNGVQPGGGPYGVCLILELPMLGTTLTPLTAAPVLTVAGTTSTSSQLLYSTSASTPNASTLWTATYTASAIWVAAYVWSTLDSYGTGTHAVLPSATGGSSGAGAVTTAQITITFSTAQPVGAGAYASGSVSVLANGIVDDSSGDLLAPGIAVGTADPSNAGSLAADMLIAGGNATPSVGTTAPGGASQIAASQAWSGEPRMDIQETASQPATTGANITWTITANNGGAGAAYATQAVKAVFGTANYAAAVIVSTPTFGGTALALKSTPTCTVTVFTCTLYYGLSVGFPGAYSGNGTCATLWCTTYSAAATWIAAVIVSGTNTYVSLLASAPTHSAGAGSVGTPQITLTYVTAQPGGAGAATTGSVSDMTTALVADGTTTYLIGPGIATAVVDSAVAATALTDLTNMGTYTTPSAVNSINAPGGASNQANSQAFVGSNITTGPYGSPAATGSYPALPNGGSAAATNNLDFTAITAPCDGGSANNGSTCTIGATTGVTVINTVANAGDALTTVTLSADAPTGWTVQLYNASACSGGTAIWPTCTQGTSITGLSTNGGIVTGTIAVANAGSANYEAVYNAFSNAAVPFAAADAIITATGAYGGQDTNTTHNDIYPGGVLQLTQTVAVTSTNCPAGISPTNLGACPGGVLAYSLIHTNIAPTGSTVTNVGSEPTFAYNALISSAGGTVITADGTAANNAWATYSFGLNAAPSDTTAGTTYAYTGSGFASGTYPTVTAGYTKFIATIGGGAHQVVAGETGTITYNVTVK